MALCNRIVAAIIFSLLTITTTSILAHGQSNQSFDILLKAYSKAKSKYERVSEHSIFTNYDSEVIYWANQYNFYKEKITKILIDTDQDARKDPHGLCLQALKMYSKYINAGSIFTTYDGMDMDDSILYFNMRSSLANYCARYEIYYNPEKM